MRKIFAAILFFFTTSVWACDSFDFPERGEISDQLRSSYAKNGYLLLKGFLTDAQCQTLTNEGNLLIKGFNPGHEALEIFCPSSVSIGKYFTDSADKISFFPEQGSTKDNFTINKIAHALGELNPAFRSVTLTRDIYNIATRLGTVDPVLNQSMLILKSKKVGGLVPAHQDSTWLFTDPDTTLAFWIPLVNVTPENSCLYGIPGSHRTPLLARYVKKIDGDGYEFIDDEGNVLDTEAMDKTYTWPDEDFIPIPMNAGDLLVFPGTFVHRSAKNISDKDRPAYTFHVIGGQAKYPEDNWLKRDKFVPIWKEDK